MLLAAGYETAVAIANLTPPQTNAPTAFLSVS